MIPCSGPVRTTLALAIGAASALLAVAVNAQPYPSKPVRIIVPFAPGGASDLLPRMVGQKLTEAWGQQIIVDNRPGGAGNIGMGLGAKAPPDGYTLLSAPNGNLVVNPHMYSKLPYDVFRDLAPITLMAAVQNILVVHPSLPVKTVRDIVSLAKARPGALTYGSPGNGSQGHVGVELLKMMTGIDMTHVPYNGVGPAIRELLGGQTSLALGQTPAVLPHVQSGRLRAVAAASPKRLAILPDLPTIAESNLAGFEAVSWYALMAPAETPREIVARLSTEITRVVRLQDIRERLNSLGAEPVGGTPDELAATMRSESSRWAKVIKTAGIKAD
ncbi:MAG TPA: tripartite tricarboxylate transporter substrate binding protein [Burkholderiales bacterium]|nr:tripartite tricarboxylate transporter substrate binding protein [Burkholderiales bacterium]